MSNFYVLSQLGKTLFHFVWFLMYGMVYGSLLYNFRFCIICCFGFYVDSDMFCTFLCFMIYVFCVQYFL
jgi:hypothetical protein